MINIANYLMKYKGRYRLKTEYDADLNSFPRDLNGQFSDNDVFIDCYNKIQIFSYGRGILQAYCPSLQRGRNIIKAIKQVFQEDIIFDIEETDSELLFKFHAKHIEDLEPILRPKTSGANISPFSNKNLPKNKAYKISDEELLTYKEISAKIPKESRILLAKYTQTFIKSLITKRNTWDNIKADMALKGLSGKEYIHSIGKWNDYIKYLQGEINGSK